MLIRSKHIFMADDDADDYYVFAEVLKEIDTSATLTWFTNCEKIVQQLEKPGNEVLPDLILLDTNMPGNVGHACLLELRNRPHLDHIPIIVYSTASSTSAEKAAHQLGAAKYVVKPSTIEELKNTVKAMLDMIKSG